MTQLKPAWTRLLTAAEEDRQDVAGLQEMLWLLNIHPDIPGFVRICHHGSDIAALSGWLNTQDGFRTCLGRWNPIFQWVNKNVELLSERIFSGGGQDCACGRERFLRMQKPSPIYRSGLKQHGLHGALWNDQEDSSLRLRYRGLQGHFLHAHIQLLRRMSSDANWIAGTEPYAGFHASIYTAAWALRRFASADSEWSSPLLQINFEESGPELSKTLRSVADGLRDNFNGAAIDDDFKAVQLPVHVQHQAGSLAVRGLRSLAYFLDWGNDMPGLRRRTGIGGKGNPQGGSQGVDGSTGITSVERRHKREKHQKASVSYDEMVLTDSNEDILYLPSLWTGSRAQRQASGIAGDHPAEEFASDKLLLADGEAAAAWAHAGSVEMANQLLPFAFGNLSVGEVADLLRSVQDREDSLEWLEVSALMHTMLWTGAPLEEALRLEVQTDRSADSSTGLKLVVDEVRQAEVDGASSFPEWCRSIPTPLGIPVKLPPSELAYPRADSLSLPDAVGGTSSILHWWRHLRTSRALNDDVLRHRKPKADIRLFVHGIDWYRERLDSLRSDHRVNERISALKIDGVLFQTIVEQTNGDIVAAAWITGKDHRLASVRRFYRASARQKLQSIYLRAATSIAEELARNGYALTVRGDAINPGNGIFVGSWNCPTLEVVRGAVHRLKNDLRDSMQISGESPTEEEFVRRHNLYTLYSVWSFGFAVGARGVHTPYLHLSQVDRFTGMARMHDKGPENGYRTRVLWLPPKAQQQIAHYNDYLSALHVSHSLPSATRANPCYFLASTTKVLDVQPRSLAPWMAKYLPFPVNVARHFVGTHLRDRGLPPEIADAWMGHWWRGEEPWGPFSSFSYHEYRRRLEILLVPLLAELGFEPLALSVAEGDAQ